MVAITVSIYAHKDRQATRNKCGRGEPVYSKSDIDGKATGLFQSGGRPGQPLEDEDVDSNDHKSVPEIPVHKARINQRDAKRMHRTMRNHDRWAACAINWSNTSEDSEASDLSENEEEKGKVYHVEYTIDCPKGEDALQYVKQQQEVAVNAMSLIDVNWFEQYHEEKQRMVTDRPGNGGNPYQHGSAPVFALEVFDEAMVAVNEQQQPSKNWNADRWIEENKGKSFDEFQKAVNRKAREIKQVKRQPQPLSMEVRASLRTINDLRQFLYNNSARERVWRQAGETPIPNEVLEKNYPDVLAWVRQWKEDVWNVKMNHDGFGLTKCPDCGLMVKSNEHKCFVVKSKKIEYKGGLPLRKQVQVLSKGDKIVTVTRKQIDLAKALENYNKAFGDLATHPSRGTLEQEQEITEPLPQLLQQLPTIPPPADQPMGEREMMTDLQRQFELFQQTQTVPAPPGDEAMTNLMEAGDSLSKGPKILCLSDSDWALIQKLLNDKDRTEIVPNFRDSNHKHDRGRRVPT